MGQWNFLSNHGMALLCVARNPDSRLREIADCVGITERAAHRIVSELVDGGFLVRKRQGNRNHYELRPDVPMPHPMLKDHWVGELLAVLVADTSTFSRGSVDGDGRPERRTGDRRKEQDRRKVDPRRSPAR